MTLVIHYSVVIKMNGPSYRAKELKRKGGGKLILSYLAMEKVRLLLWNLG